MQRNSLLKLVAGGLAAVLIVLIVLLLTAHRAAPGSFYTPDLPKVLVVAHKGGDGLWPGNTMYAFQHAVDLGVDVLETDLHQTKDGVLVFGHDDRVEMVSDGTGNIWDFAYADLKKLDAGYRWTQDNGQSFPYRGQGITYTSVEAVFQAFPHMRFYMDMKQTEPPIYAAFCQLIRQYHMENRVVAASFSHANITAFRKLCPEVTTSADQTETLTFVFLNFAYLGRLFSPEFQVFHVPVEASGITVMTPRFVSAARERNVRVEVWTINEAAEMERLIAMGVEGIISDRPDTLLKVVGR
jgi:glycerophosphoryl diester phosphodiesterase